MRCFSVRHQKANSRELEVQEITSRLLTCVVRGDRPRIGDVTAALRFCSTMGMAKGGHPPESVLHRQFLLLDTILTPVLHLWAHGRPAR